VGAGNHLEETLPKDQSIKQIGGRKGHNQGALVVPKALFVDENKLGWTSKTGRKMSTRRISAGGGRTTDNPKLGAIRFRSLSVKK